MIKEILLSILTNPIIQAIIIGFVLTAISWMVKRFADEKAQRYWESIRSAAITAFNFAEKIIPDSTKPWEKKNALQKIDAALKHFNENVAQRFNRAANQKEVNIAQDLWAEMAIELKKN